MADLIKLETAAEVPTPPAGYCNVFFELENGEIKKKAKKSDGTTVELSAEQQEE